MKKKELTSHQLIESALGLFAHHGIEKTSLAMIASEVGITKPSIYYHFASKEELIERVFDYIFVDYHFDHYFSPHEYDAHNFAEKLVQEGLGMFPEDNEVDFPIIRLLNEFLHLAGHNESYTERLASMQQEFLDGFHDLLIKGVELGVVENQNVESKGHMLALLIDNITSYQMMQLKLNYTEIWKEAVNSVLVKGEKIIG